MKTKFWEDLVKKMKEKETGQAVVVDEVTEKIDENKEPLESSTDRTVVPEDEQEEKQEDEQEDEEKEEEKEEQGEDSQEEDESASLHSDNFDVRMKERFGIVIDKCVKYKERVAELTDKNSSTSDRKLFDRVMEAVMKNLVPKTSPVLIKETLKKDENGNVVKENGNPVKLTEEERIFIPQKASDWRGKKRVAMTANGFGLRATYNTRYDSVTVRSLLEWIGKDSLVELLELCVWNLENEYKYRTGKRAIKRLKKLIELFKRNGEGMENMNKAGWEQTVEHGEGLVWVGSTQRTKKGVYGGYGGKRSIPTGFNTANLTLELDSNDLYVKTKLGEKDSHSRQDMDFLPMSDIQDDIVTVLAFSNVVDELPLYLDEMEKKQEQQRKEVESVKKGMKEQFAQEILVKTAKDLKKGE